MNKHFKDMWKLFKYLLAESLIAMLVLVFCIAVLVWVIK
jgi:hypothetical protein